MNPLRIGFFVLAVNIGLPLFQAEASERANENYLPKGMRNLSAMLEQLGPTLRSTGGFGRIYFSTVCDAKDGSHEALPFPSLNVQPISKGKIGMLAVRDIFRNDKNIRVTQDQTQMVRVRVGVPSCELLRTKINSLVLTREERYNSLWAVRAIEEVKEFRSAMNKLRYNRPVEISNWPIVQPAKGLPHLPRSLKGMSVDEALDLIARTFRLIISYGECADEQGERTYSIGVNYVDVD